MTRVSRSGAYLLFTIICLGEAACLRRPATTPSHMLEPQLLEPQLPQPATQVTKAPNATPVRLLDTHKHADTSAAVFCTSNRMVS